VEEKEIFRGPPHPAHLGRLVGEEVDAKTGHMAPNYHHGAPTRDYLVGDKVPPPRPTPTATAYRLTLPLCHRSSWAGPKQGQ